MMKAIFGDQLPAVPDGDHQALQRSSAERALEQTEQDFWRLLHSHEPLPAFEAARLSEHKQQYRDWKLFANFPHLFAVAKNVLDKKTGLVWGDRNGLNDNTLELIDFLDQQGIAGEHRFHTNFSPWTILPTARYMCVSSFVDRALLDKRLEEVVKPWDADWDKHSLDEKKTKWEELLAKYDEKGLALREFLEKSVAQKGDVLGGRLHFGSPELMAETIEKLRRRVSFNNLRLRSKLAIATIDDWQEEDKAMPQKGSDPLELSQRVLAELQATEPQTLRYAAIHANIPFNGFTRELQLRYHDPQGALLKMYLAVSRSMRDEQGRFGLRQAGLTNLVEELRIPAVNAAQELLREL